MSTPIQPIYLLADSRPLFWKRDDVLFLDSVRALIASPSPRAAYIGASNGDVPDYFEIFLAAMAQVGIIDCRLIRSTYPGEDAAFLEQADLILLAGGDVEAGWRVIEATGMSDAIHKRFREGTVLIGTSAGAIQLGLYGARQIGPVSNELFETFKLVPFMVDTHDEGRHWSRLGDTIGLLNNGVRGIGIPAGGGAIFHPDGQLEPVRWPVETFDTVDGRLERGSLSAIA